MFMCFFLFLNVARIARESRGRLGASAKMSSKFGIEVTAAGLLVDERLVRITELWSVCRKILLKHIRMHVAKRLAARRPAYYAGLCGFNSKQHLKALGEVDSYTASCYIKIWTGSVMTGARRSQMGNGTGECPCGAASQSFAHMLWDCPISPPVSPKIEHFHTLPAYRFVAHLLVEGADAKDIQTWQVSMTRAVKIICMKEFVPEHVRERVVRDHKVGHSLATSEDGSYVFCAKCYISRKSRDRQWILARPCAYPERIPRSLHEAFVCNGHRAVLEMKKWKVTVLRPSFRCLECEVVVWVTASLCMLVPVCRRCACVRLCVFLCVCVCVVPASVSLQTCTYDRRRPGM